jgi:hypothetical protein
MTSKKYLTLREAYASIYEKKEKPEMEDDSKHEEEEGEKKSKHSKKEKEEESESVEEGFGEKAAELLDKGTKKIQSGLEKMGVPINRTKRQMGTSPRGEKLMRDAGVGPSEKPTGLNNSADLFDIVKGHLMSEGYADTEEAALAIMANMSEEWRQTILEADSVDKMRERAEKRRQQRYGKQGGGGRDDYRPYTEDDYKNPKPGYGSSQVKPA